MFPNPKDLLKTHRHILARLQIAKMELKACTATLAAEKEAAIESMALGGRPLDGMPKARNRGSNTEYVALHYQDHAKGDLLPCEARAEALRQEIHEIKMQIKLHKAVMNALTEAEAQFVALHYDDSLTFNQISDICLVAGEQTCYSVSTLKRMNQVILRKAESLIRPHK